MWRLYLHLLKWTCTIGLNMHLYSFNTLRACWEILLSLSRSFADFFENQFFISRVIKRVLVWNKLFAKVISRQH